MPQLVAVNNQSHKNIKIDSELSCQQQQSINMVPVVVDEFQKLVTSYPILFTKNQNTGKFVCIALMGFQDGENLFWRNGKLDALYTPLNFERFPFYAGIDKNEMVVCLDMENPGVQLSTGRSLFNETGEQSELLVSATRILATLSQGESKTQKFIELLSELKLIQPIKIDIELHDHKRVEVNGLYSIDEEKLNQETISVLFEHNYLKLVYAMTLSLGHIAELIRRRNVAIDQGTF